MEPIQGCPRRSSEQLGPGGDGEDRISVLDDDMLLLVLERLGCVRAAARTGALSRRWRGLWTSLRQIVIREVPLSSLEAALGCVSRPPPGLSLLDIRVPDKKPDAADVTSLLSAAALLEPKKLVFAVPSRVPVNSPMFFLQLPAEAKFPVFDTLSLSGCHVRFDSLLPVCPLLRVLRLKFGDHGSHEDIKTFMSVHSASLQELYVDAEGVVRIDTVDLVLPQLKQLMVCLRAYSEVNISVVAPMVDTLSWQWSYFSIKFGLWRILKLRLQRSERQRELASLHIHARITSSIVHGEVENSTQEIEKHMIAKFYILELHLKTKGHVFGAFVFHLLGMNQCFSSMRRLRVVLHKSTLKQECPPDCACDNLDWRSQTISLTSLEEVEINSFEGYNHEIDFLKLIFKSAPMLKKMTVSLSYEVPSCDDRCTQIHDIFGAYPSVNSYLYLTCGEYPFWRNMAKIVR